MSAGRPHFRLHGRSSTPLPPVLLKRSGEVNRPERRTSPWEVSDGLRRLLWDDENRKARLEGPSIWDDPWTRPVVIVYQVVESEDNQTDSASNHEKSVKNCGSSIRDCDVSANVETGSSSRSLSPPEQTPLAGPQVDARIPDTKAIMSPGALPGVQPWEYHSVKALIERRSQNKRLPSTAAQGLKELGECEKSLGWELTAYNCERAINEVCSRLQSKPLFSPKPKRLTKEYPSEGLAGVVEEGSLVKVDRRLDSSAQTTLERLRGELNQKQEKKVHTITELRARRAAVTISGTSQ